MRGSGVGVVWLIRDSRCSTGTIDRLATVGARPGAAVDGQRLARFPSLRRRRNAGESMRVFIAGWLVALIACAAAPAIAATADKLAPVTLDDINAGMGVAPALISQGG